jgi:hypothetical protein
VDDSDPSGEEVDPLLARCSGPLRVGRGCGAARDQGGAPATPWRTALVRRLGARFPAICIVQAVAFWCKCDFAVFVGFPRRFCDEPSAQLSNPPQFRKLTFFCITHLVISFCFVFIKSKKIKKYFGFSYFSNICLYRLKLSLRSNVKVAETVKIVQ